MQQGKQTMNIKFTVTKPLKLSVWSFDQPRLKAGETASIVGWYVADATNPLYKVQKANGEIFACHRQYIIEAGGLSEYAQ